MKRHRMSLCRTGMLLAIFISAALLSGCGRTGGKDTAEIKRPRVSGVTVEAVPLSETDQFIETSGTVRSRTVSLVASRMMGTVTAVKAGEGDRVRAGQLLAIIDDRDVAQKVKAAEHAVEAARQQKSLADVTYQRYKNLHDDRALTGQELDQAGTQKQVAASEYERAQAMLEEARIYQGFTRVVSPVAGVVTEKKTDLGSTVVPGMQLFAVEDTSGYRVEANFDEKNAAAVKPGTVAKVTIASLNRDLDGTVTEVVPSVDPATRSFLVKIAVKSDGLRNGAYAKVAIPAGKRPALLVSKQAVVERGQLTGLYLVDANGLITYRLIRTGRSYGDRIEVLTGLNPGDTVIVEGVDRAVDGGMLVPPGNGTPKD